MRLPAEEGRRRHQDRAWIGMGRGKGRLTEVWLPCAPLGRSLKLINRFVDSQFIDSHAAVPLFYLFFSCVSSVLHFLITCRAPNEE